MLRWLMRLSSHSHPTHWSPVPSKSVQLMHTRLNKFKKARSAADSSSSDLNANFVPQSHQQQSPVPDAKPRVIIITGPTAVGKTKLGLELAKQIGGEVISADSVQVYKGLDIGSDKLPVEQQEGIPHHLIDILDPADEFSAGDFHRLGRQAAEDIIARGKVPIVAGGTGFYLRWFIHGRPSTPASSPEAAAKALQLLGQAWVQAAAEVAAAQQQQQQQQVAQSQQQQQVAQLQGRRQLVDVASGSSFSNGIAGRAVTSAGKGVSDGYQFQGQQQQQQQEQQQREQQQQQQQQQQEQPAAHASSMQQQAMDADTNTQPTQTTIQPPAVNSSSSSSTLQALEAAIKPHVISPEAAAAALQLQEEQRWDVAVDVVQQLGDPETAARIRAERNNWYRLQRVLQILVQNGGKPLSQLDVDTTKELDYDFRCFFLHRPRLELFERIVYRVEEMVAGGLLPEVLSLLDRGMQPNSNIATRAIGYRQALKFLQAAIATGSASEQQLHQLIFDIATASRNLVKNQTTWFRDDELFRWVEVSGRSTDDVLQVLLAELDKSHHEGGCGDSGRFDKATQNALKRYVPALKIFNDPEKMAAVLDCVAEAAAARRGQGGDEAHAVAATDSEV